MRFLLIIGLLAGIAPLVGCARNPPEVMRQPEPDGDLREQFDARYQAWRKKIDRACKGFPHELEIYREWSEFERLVDLGPNAVPFFIEKIDESAKFAKDDTPPRDPAFLLDGVVGRIVHKKFKDTKEVLSWWQTRGEAPVRFRQAYEQWKQAKRDGQSLLQVEETVFDERTKRPQARQTRTELGKAYFAILDLGIDALPFIVDTIKAGDYDLLPIYGVVGGWRFPPERAGSLAEQAKEALEFWEKHRDDRVLPPAPAAQQKEQKP
jgi:hypothetical protein